MYENEAAIMVVTNYVIQLPVEFAQQEMFQQFEKQNCTVVDV